MTLLAVAVALFFALVGCSAQPIDTPKTGNPDVTAEIIAEVDGCQVYRLQDGTARTIYFVRCPGGMTKTSWEVTQSTGKSMITHHYDVDTDAR